MVWGTRKTPSLEAHFGRRGVENQKPIQIWEKWLFAHLNSPETNWLTILESPNLDPNTWNPLSL